MPLAALGDERSGEPAVDQVISISGRIRLSSGMHDEIIPQAESGESPGACPTQPAITFESLTFSDGTTITLGPNDIVVFVGPNNARKSAALREIETHIGASAPGVVVKSASLRRTGTVEDLRALLAKHAVKSSNVNNDFRYKGFHVDVNDSVIQHFWEHAHQHIRGLFCQHISTESRIVDSNPASAISTLNEAPSHPIHLLFSDDNIELRLSGYFRRAFNKDLILFRQGGGSWPLLVGERSLPLPGEDCVSASFNKRLLEAAVPLQSQGDGMRSFASVILHLLTPATLSVLLLDEPEAFLHPPQARLLGEFIAKERPGHSQLFIATHSPDVLQGLLSAAPDHLRVIRIQRDGSVNRVKELDKGRARVISSDPVMKFSSVLSGIFHQRVIICESDADCMFYSSILDLPMVRGEQQPDVLFVHAGGKHRMAALAETLRMLDVRVDVIADIDILNEEAVLERLVKALGGDSNKVAANAGPLKTAIEQHKPWLTASEVAKGIRGALGKSPSTGEFPRVLQNEIEAIFRKASPWDAVKDAGRAAVPAGQPMHHYNALINDCAEFGLWIVPVGELEGFYKTDGGKGPRWVQRVLGRDLANDTELEDARNFVGKVWARLNSKTG
jgi:hypothetical protein